MLIEFPDDDINKFSGFLWLYLWLVIRIFNFTMHVYSYLLLFVMVFVLFTTLDDFTDVMDSQIRIIGRCYFPFFFGLVGIGFRDE